VRRSLYRKAKPSCGSLGGHDSQTIDVSVMHGEFHLPVSILVCLPTFMVLHNSTTSVALTNCLVSAMMGVMVGSLLPDVDASDSKIMHGTWKPIGFVGKYVFYRPMVRLLGNKRNTFRDEHRGFLHSLLGCLMASAFFAVPTLIIFIVLTRLVEMETAVPVWYIWIGVQIGFLLHLAEDSFTRSGVRWFFPRGEPTRSTTRTFRSSGSEFLLLLIFIVTFGTLTLIVNYLPVSLVTLLASLGATPVLLIFLHRINPRISELGDKAYLREMVEDYLARRGGLKTDPSEPRIPVVRVESDSSAGRRPYVARITDVGGEWGLERRFFTPPHAEAARMRSGNVVEVRTRDLYGSNRVYYVVRNGLFCPFGKLIEPDSPEPGDMVDLLGLEWSGVEVGVKEPGTMNRRWAGEYDYGSCEIHLRREITTYWFATLTTLLHEYGHHKYRRLRHRYPILAFLPAIGSSVYGLVAPSSLSNLLTMLLSIAGLLIAAFLMFSYFETIADKYAADHVPSIFLLLSGLELVEVVEKLQDRKMRVSREMGRFYRNMKKYNPQHFE